MAQGHAPFEGHKTWYQVVGDLATARSGAGPAPLVTLHGGPGATHDYMLSKAARTFALLDADPTVYYTTNGPSEFHVVGSFKDWSAVDRLPSISVPTLVISGRNDEATPRLQEVLVDRIAGADQVIMEQSSHMPFWEERDAYMAAVGGFLARHD